jgi:hypothetical protein
MRRGGGAALLSVALTWVASIGTAQEPVRVEGIAALVGGTSPGSGTSVVLRSDVVLRARIALAGRTQRLPTGPVPTSLLGAMLEEILGEVLIEREADRLRAERPSDEEIARERARLEEQAGGATRLGQLLEVIGAGTEEIDAIALRRAYVSAFLRANLEGSTLVSDAQLARVYESGEHPFAGRPLDDVREPLRAWIAQTALQRDVRRWIEVLRRRTPVRVLAEWERPAGADAE